MNRIALVEGLAPKKTPPPPAFFGAVEIEHSMAAGFVEYLDGYLSRQRVIRRGMLLAIAGFREALKPTLAGAVDIIPHVHREAMRRLNALLTWRTLLRELPEAECSPARGFAHVVAIFNQLPAEVLNGWRQNYPKNAVTSEDEAVKALAARRLDFARRVAAQYVTHSLVRESMDFRRSIVGVAA